MEENLMEVDSTNSKCISHRNDVDFQFTLNYYSRYIFGKCCKCQIDSDAKPKKIKLHQSRTGCMNHGILE